MIFLFFVPGMFGHTTELVIRKFSNEYNKIKDSTFQSSILDTPVTSLIQEDGSLHSFRLEMHDIDYNNIPTPKSNSIITPIYPGEFLELEEIADKFSNFDQYHNSPRIVMYADSLEAAEFNMLVQWKKVVPLLHCGEKIMFENFNNNINQWNKNYTSFKDAQRWEIREWFSLSYPKWVSKWMYSHKPLDSTYLKISNNDYLNTTQDCFKKIFDYCNLTFDQSLAAEYNDFINVWQSAQQPIVNEYTIVNNIVDAVIKKYEYNWNDLNIIQESIVQKKLKDHGLELKCWGLNTFPTNTAQLNNYLERLSN